MAKRDDETLPERMLIKHLNTTIKNLSEKILLLQGQAAEVERLRKEVTKSEKIRLDLSSCLKESGNKIAEDVKAEIEFRKELIEKNKEIIEENQQLRMTISELVNEKNNLKARVKEIATRKNIMESNVTILMGKIKNEEVTENILHALEDDLKKVEEKYRMDI